MSQRENRFFAKRSVFMLGHFDQLRLHVIGSGHGDGHFNSAKAGGYRGGIQVVQKLLVGGGVNLMNKHARRVGGVIV